MSRNAIKKILCAASILAIATLAAGCDDGDDCRQARRHTPPPKHRHHHEARVDHHRHMPPPECSRDRERRRPRADMAGVYKATAMNSAVTFKGASYYIDIFEDNDELYLTLPNGSEYPISFENGKMSVAGGLITEQIGGTFLYKDKKGGTWLVEKAE